MGIIAGMVDLAAHLSIECLKLPIGSVAGTCVKTTSPCRLVGGYPLSADASEKSAVTPSETLSIGFVQRAI